MGLSFSNFSGGWASHMGGCPNSGPFLGTLDIRCCIKIGVHKKGP